MIHHTRKKKRPALGKAYVDLFGEPEKGYGMCILNDEGVILSWNKLAEKQTGYASEDIVGKNHAQLFTKEANQKHEPARSLAYALKYGRHISEGLRVAKGGGILHARSSVTLIRTKKGIFFVLSMQDISESNALNKRREEYIGVVSHELRNPIATLSLYSELLEKALQLETDKNKLSTLHDIQGQTARLVTLVDDLLVVNNIKSNTLELHLADFDAGAFMRLVIRSFQTITPTHRLQFLAGKGACNVTADKNRIGQVLVNLLTNAVKYSPNAKRVIVRLVRQENKCVISVQDFGEGISPKDQKSLFTRFFRTYTAHASDVGGSGLGLYISKEIIKRHRERLWLTSKVGEGTTFFFSLRLASKGK